MDSVWISLGPLLAFNLFMMTTVIIYGCIDKKVPVDQEVVERHASHFVNRWFRAYWTWLVSPFERFFVRCHISPNYLTIAGVMIAGVGAAVFYATGHLGLAGWMVIIGGTFDMFDGRVARATGQVTKSGAYYDAVMDRYSEGIAYFGLLYYYREHWMFWVVLMASLGAFCVSYTKARAEAMGIQVKGGSMQRPERVVYLGVASIFSPVIQVLSRKYSPFPEEQFLLMLALIFMAIATHSSAIARIREAMAALRALEGHVPVRKEQSVKARVSQPHISPLT